MISIPIVNNVSLQKLSINLPNASPTSDGTNVLQDGATVVLHLVQIPSMPANTELEQHNVGLQQYSLRQITRLVHTVFVTLNKQGIKYLPIKTNKTRTISAET